ncbi:nucleotidyltransferase domain-containing protein [Actinoplanes sp. CA-051413]|uniref:nucleotidyltransferase domain-containing protein n=1 Tax=Actinoplanes sp. CA-051413 TaxID=3239899 RepID=UPI003D9697F9
MNDQEREDLLASWVQPSSATEKDQQERAERMVSDAIKAWPALRNTSMRIYAKGSYPNNTNVRADSDVDIVVECHECTYFDYEPGVTPAGSGSSYTGKWEPELWRQEVGNALRSHFGAQGVDLTGRVALNVKAVEGSRPSADVVPSFHYVRYVDPNRTRKHDGSCVFDTDQTQIVNWPQQQLDNGRAKNTSTDYRYKKYVRALKRCENKLVEIGEIEDLPSYFMECLIWNVEDSTLKSGANLQAGFRATLFELWDGIEKGVAQESWVEPNELKWLFKGHNKWTTADAKKLVQATWTFLDYGS